MGELLFQLLGSDTTEPRLRRGLASRSGDRHPSGAFAPRRHPTSDVLGSMVIGDRSPGTALIIAFHAKLCPKCSAILVELGDLGETQTAPRIGRWTRVSPGVTLAEISEVSGLGEVVYAARVDAGFEFAPACGLRLADIVVTDGLAFSGKETYGRGDYGELEATHTRLLAHPVRGFSAIFSTETLGFRVGPYSEISEVCSGLAPPGRSG